MTNPCLAGDQCWTFGRIKRWYVQHCGRVGQGAWGHWSFPGASWSPQNGRDCKGIPPKKDARNIQTFRFRHFCYLLQATLNFEPTLKVCHTAAHLDGNMDPWCHGDGS